MQVESLPLAVRDVVDAINLALQGPTSESTKEQLMKFLHMNCEGNENLVPAIACAFEFFQTLKQQLTLLQKGCDEPSRLSALVLDDFPLIQSSFLCSSHQDLLKSLLMYLSSFRRHLDAEQQSILESYIDKIQFGPRVLKILDSTKFPEDTMKDDLKAIGECAVPLRTKISKQRALKHQRKQVHVDQHHLKSLVWLESQRLLQRPNLYRASFCANLRKL